MGGEACQTFFFHVSLKSHLFSGFYFLHANKKVLLLFTTKTNQFRRESLNIKQNNNKMSRTRNAQKMRLF